MKKFFLITATAFGLFAQAQTKEGKVVYERTVQLSNLRLGGGNLPPEIQAQMANLPKSRTDQFELLFTPEHSLYQFLPNAADDGGNQTFAAGGMMIQMRGGQNTTTYVDFARATQIDQREIMDKSFVVTDTLTKLQWKLSEETKPVLNFTAHKATATTINQRPRMTMENGQMKREMVADTAKVIAWYTTEVPVPAGPNYAGQLPGLILELDVNNGQSVTKAIEFSPKVDPKKIKVPNDGKKLTAAEFGKEREKMMEEMQKNMPQGARFRMQ
ncbi:GLPGLI family protein [Flavisolibacter ginsenosidimutans]|uniref:GLPGLI family protein n=1 Tax=Flavisolibacter ginsenosidimutans TaxID=661481 RepID=A0A5B8UNX1_9BACT|nr:GLPGLI family protein [Flavisolibacter ginsenosidimutans]QEC57645.1 GLPGLI family protein [Flavisolibacter ginsenosidimutans]